MTRLTRLVLLVLLVATGGTVWAQSGGFLEPMGTLPRSRYSSGDITAFLPSTRGPFTFPAPYNTQAIRLTDATDCTASADCVWYVGYSYWNNINAHQKDPNTFYVFLGLEWNRGGVGPTIFSVNKHTLVPTKIGPLFDSADANRFQHGGGWYFSFNGDNPTRLYLGAMAAPSTAFKYIDILTKAVTTVFDIAAHFGANRGMCQMHSSADDLVHAGSLIDTTAGHSCGALTATDKLGCFVYEVTGPVWHYYPEIAGKDFDECNLDKSGRYVISLETTGGTETTYNRIFDNTTETETRVTGPTSTLGHLDTGYWYAYGADNYNAAPNASIATLFLPSVSHSDTLHYNHPGSGAWEIVEVQHIAHGNALVNTTSRNQMACGSDSSTYTSVQNEIICFRGEHSYGQQLVVAPVMTNPATGGGFDSYGRAPKGNIDPTGEWFIWTSNLAGSSRLDAFIVRVPQHQLKPHANH